MKQVVFVILILPFYDAAVRIIERGRAFKFRVTNSHIRTDRGIVDRLAEKGDLDLGKGR